jgi:hypothetical protein
MVRALRAQGHVVGFMGDGINDAPALRAADIGISVDSAVDIAKEAADIILLEKNLMVLEEGVIEGRRFSNMLKYIRMTASSNFGNVFSVLVASAFLPFLPMLPLQLLVQNLLYDISQIAIPFDNVDEELVRKPLRGTRRTSALHGVLRADQLDLRPDLLRADVVRVRCRTPADQGLFQSGWFVVGLLTQTLIVHMIRTPVPSCEHRRAAAAADDRPDHGHRRLPADEPAGRLLQAAGARRLLAVPGGDPVRLCGADHCAEEVLHPSLRLAVAPAALSREKHNGHQSEPAGVQRRRNSSSLISLSVAFVLGTAIGLERQCANAPPACAPIRWWRWVRRCSSTWPCASMTCTAARRRAACGGLCDLRRRLPRRRRDHEGRRAGVRPEHRRHPVGLGGGGRLRGHQLLPEAVLAAVFVLAANTLLRPVVNRIQRQPLPEAFSEATYAINVVCQREQQAEVLDQLLLLLEQAHYPVRAVDQRPFGERDVEIGAVCHHRRCR